jgi:hypothetical protein
MNFSIEKCFIYLSFLGMLSSCGRSEIEDAPWNHTQVPVVYSVISPGSRTQVYLGKTCNSSLAVEKNPYPEAKVYICGPDSVWTELTRLKADTSVFADTQNTLAIVKGKTYSLKIVLNNTTVHAQTTVLDSYATFKEISCISSGKTDDDIINGEWVISSINRLNVKMNLASNEEYGYILSAFSREIWGDLYLKESRFETDNCSVPKDSTSFILNLTTVNPLVNELRKAVDINSNEVSEDDGALVTYLTESFGGVLPQYSNIVNGVGLFGNAVTVSKRVEITKADE